jgi:hypothetical protein
MLSLQLKTPTPASPLGFPVVPFAQQVSPSELVSVQSGELASFIQLNFSELQSFEVVRHQYQAWGIEFEQTIALQPSNFAFTDLEQPMGLMPIAHPCMAIQFHQPRQVIKAKLVGARTILVTAFDAENRIVARCELNQSMPSMPSPLAATQNGFEAVSERTLPLHTLYLQANAIARIELTSAAPFMLQRFCCI